jgi:hypothetical protein
MHVRLAISLVQYQGFAAKDGSHHFSPRYTVDELISLAQFLEKEI